MIDKFNAYLEKMEFVDNRVRSYVWTVNQFVSLFGDIWSSSERTKNTPRMRGVRFAPVSHGLSLLMKVSLLGAGTSARSEQLSITVSN